MATISETRGQLITYEVYYGENSTRWLGMATLDLPEISMKTVDLTGPGIAGTVAMPTPGMSESFECTVHWRSIHGDLTTLLEMHAHDLTFRGAQNIYDAGTGKTRAQPVKINLRGLPKKSTLGKFEQASETDSESNLEILHLQIFVDEVEIIEIDKLNQIFKVNGTDYLADVATAIGLR